MTAKDKKIIEDSERDGIPIFVLTAKDLFSVDAIESYFQECRSRGCTQKHTIAIDLRINEFKEWQSDNPEKVKIPD